MPALTAIGPDGGSRLFTVKICGVRRLEDARAAVDAGADAIGLNFHAPSPRCVDRDEALRIAAGLPQSIIKVGVFVNRPADEVGATCNALQLDLLQIHGDEPPEYLAELAGRPIIRALRLAHGHFDEVLAYLDRCRTLGVNLQSVLLDAARPGQYGGTGHVIDWPAAAQYALRRDLPPLTLAGGLTPENVAEAIRIVRPAAVDVASGVESSRGVQSAELIRSFVTNARRAFDAQRSSE